MSKKIKVPWYEAEEQREEGEKKLKKNDDGVEVHLGDGRDADQPGGNGSGLFYCGRSLGEDVIANSDGDCGPYGGPQCPSCVRFQLYQESRHDVGSDLQNLFKEPGANVRLLQDRVKGKVQQILAGRDLSETTIRNLRSALEEKLGLPADSLQSTKRLRKWVFQVLEQEVLKKSQRSSKCERICRALADMETYPDNCRRMLLDALPSAMAHPDGGSNGGDVPHPHQVRLLETVQMALQESLDNVQAQSEAVEARLQEEQTKLTGLEQARDAVAASATDVRAEFDSHERVLSAAQEACENAKADVENSKQVKIQAVESRQGLLQAQVTFAAVHTTFSELLEDNSFSEAAVQQKLEEVSVGLKAIGTESSLVTAALSALVKARGARSAFEEVSAKAVGKVFAAHSAKVEQDLLNNTILQGDEPIETAEVLLDAMTQNASSKTVVLQNIRENLESKDVKLKAAKKEAKQQSQTLTSCQRERDALLAKSTELAAVLGIEKQLIGCIDPPSPGPIARGASSLLDDVAEETLAGDETQGAEDTQEAPDAAMSLGNDLIAAAVASEDAPQGAEGAAEEPPEATSQESTIVVNPANLQGAFELAAEEKASQEEKADETEAATEAACEEPPTKKQKLDVTEEVVKEEAVEQDVQMDTDEAQAEVPSAAPVKVQTSADLQSVIVSGGA